MQKSQVGIVEFTENGGYPQIRFRKPYFILIFMGFLILFLLTVQCLVLLRFKSSGMLSVFILLGITLLTIREFYKAYTFECSIELQDGKIICNLNGAVVKQIDTSKIHGITANELTDRLVDADCIPKRPAVLIVADPENATIKGPRKFTDAEANFILTILNNHRHNIINSF